MKDLSWVHEFYTKHPYLWQINVEGHFKHGLAKPTDTQKRKLANMTVRVVKTAAYYCLCQDIHSDRLIQVSIENLILYGG